VAEAELDGEPERSALDAGSTKDNGQTGRKLVMDYYGPRVPIGGGAISAGSDARGSVRVRGRPGRWP